MFSVEPAATSSSDVHESGDTRCWRPHSVPKRVPASMRFAPADALHKDARVARSMEAPLLLPKGKWRGDSGVGKHKRFAALTPVVRWVRMSTADRTAAIGPTPCACTDIPYMAGQSTTGRHRPPISHSEATTSSHTPRHPHRLAHRLAASAPARAADGAKAESTAKGRVVRGGILLGKLHDAGRVLGGAARPSIRRTSSPRVLAA